jgi:hypothetical protein
MAACLPALNKHGIAVLQPTYDDEHGAYVKTVLVHGDSGESVECRTRLIIGKNDMQGYGSAITYARRYGLMGMVGIAPEDDDGNAAAKAAPKGPSSAHMKRRLEALDNELADAASDVAIDALARSWMAEMTRDMWPDPAAGSDDYEHSFRRVVAQKFKARRNELEAWAASQEAAE